MLIGKNVIVTGGSRGIGRAIAIEFGKLGANVVINYVSNEKEAEEVAKEVEGLGGKALIVKGDVSKVENSKFLIEETIKNFGSIDVLVNNAGITRDNLLIRMTDDEFEKVIDVNLKGVYNTCKCAIRHMMKQRKGRIINISSVVE